MLWACHSASARLARLSRQASPGLSLIEVLVTLAIIGAASSVIVITAVPPDPARIELQRFRQTVEAAAGRAAVSGAPTGILITEAIYEPVTWRSGEWQSVPGQSRRIPAGMRFDIRRQDSLDRRASEPGKDKGVWPAIIFDPLGHTAPVEITLSHRRTAHHVQVSAEGVAFDERRR